MKKNIFLLLPLMAILMPLGMHAQAGREDGRVEVYYTSSDYIHGKKDPEYTLMYDEKVYKQGEDRKAGIKIKKLKAFAVKDNAGYTFRVNEWTRMTNYYYRVLDTGKIWFYVEEDVPFTSAGGIVPMRGADLSKKYPSPADLKIVKLYLIRAASNFGAGTDPTDMKFKNRVFISKGPDGKLLECTEGNMKDLMADDADIVAQIKDKGIAQGPYGDVEKKFDEDYTNVSAWIEAYNSKHKK